jgi:hypothetical protein
MRRLPGDEKAVKNSEISPTAVAGIFCVLTKFSPVTPRIRLPRIPRSVAVAGAFPTNGGLNQS